MSRSPPAGSLILWSGTSGSEGTDGKRPLLGPRPCGLLLIDPSHVQMHRRERLGGGLQEFSYLLREGHDCGHGAWLALSAWRWRRWR